MSDTETINEWTLVSDCITKPDEAEQATSTCTAEMFTDRDARNVFTAIRDLERDGLPSDINHVIERLEQRRQLNESTADRLAEAAQSVRIASPVSYLAGKVLEQHRDRSFWMLLEQCQSHRGNGASRGDLITTLTTDLAELGESKARRSFEGVDVAELAEHATSEPEWLVDRIFSAEQPTLFGARSKCLKTTLLVDLAVALADGSQWLQTFSIPRPRRTLFITGESNARAISRRISKACESRDKTLADLQGMLRVEAVQFPKLPRLDDCVAIGRTVQRHGIECVIIDPLYRGLTDDIDTHRMNQVSDAIVNFTQSCQPAAVIISHHSTKSAARELGSPPSLEDMTGSGIAEAFGNWFLIGRNQEYQWNWTHDLCVSYGGRDEQCGARRIVFNESTWTADVESMSDFIGQRQEAAENARDEARQATHTRKLEQARSRILRIMRNVKTPQSKRELETRRGEIAQLPFREAFADMLQDQTISTHNYRDSLNRLVTGGYLLAEYSHEYEQGFNQSEDAR